MRLINHYIADIHILDITPEKLCPQPFGRQVKKLEIPVDGIVQRKLDFPPGHSKIDCERLDAPVGKILHLVLHQGNQRRDHKGNPRLHQSRHLKAHGLPPSSRKNGEHILSVQCRADYVLLHRPERRIAPIFTEDISRSNIPGDISRLRHPGICRRIRYPSANRRIRHLKPNCRLRHLKPSRRLRHPRVCPRHDLLLNIGLFHLAVSTFTHLFLICLRPSGIGTFCAVKIFLDRRMHISSRRSPRQRTNVKLYLNDCKNTLILHRIPERTGGPSGNSENAPGHEIINLNIILEL